MTDLGWICFYYELFSRKNAFPLPSPHIPFLTQESLFCHQREPLFFKRRKSDIFCSKKFAMSLIRTIFAFENGREVANLGFVFTVCLHSAFALPSLPEAKKNTRQCGSRGKAQTRALWHICLLDFLKTQWMEPLREFGIKVPVSEKEKAITRNLVS